MIKEGYWIEFCFATEKLMKNWVRPRLHQAASTL